MQKSGSVSNFFSFELNIADDPTQFALSPQMEPLMSTSKSHERFDYSPRPSEELFDSKEDIGRKSKIAPKVFIWFLAFTWLIAAAILVAIYHRVTYLQNCTCQEMNDAGSNLLVNGDSSIISKVARPYHYLEPGFDIDDFVAADPLWASLFPGKL